MQKYQILWVDDEIDLLKPHILFLGQKGYDVTPVTNGSDALDICEERHFDLIFLDENMPGMSGLEVLTRIKQIKPSIPVVMITKSEEENLMEDAIGSRIADYLIKPVNPNQILLSIKKLLDHKRLFTEKTNHSYQQDFRNISLAFNNDMDFEEWEEVYRKLVFWETEIENTENKSMKEVLEMQKTEANVNFAKFIKENYEYWLNDAKINDRPIMSHDLMQRSVFPLLKDKQDQKPLFFILIDNLRLDQWKVIQPLFSELFIVKEENTYCSILPTTTSYARNAIFSGLLPLQMSERYPQYWMNDEDDGNKNNFEEEFFQEQLKRSRMNTKYSYNKILRNHQGVQLVNNFHTLLQNELNLIVYNFVDMLSHARTDTAIVRELAHDEAAYRSVTHSWFLHSTLYECIKKIAESGCRLIITTDHGTIRTQNPFKIIGDRETNTNLRYKQGKNLNFKGKNILVATHPERFFLPKVNVSTAFVFATEDYFFAYPNNYNHYVKYYKDTFQHGGISMEEMIIPFIVMDPK